MVVFPSNASLSDRALGMAESTLRRHLAALVEKGLITRNDSPNGKRYARRRQGGAIAQAYGFNLRPLLVQAAQITAIGADLTAAKASLRQQRAAIVLRLRDATKLMVHIIETGQLANVPDLLDKLKAIGKGLRRQMSSAVICQISALLEAQEQVISAILIILQSLDLGGNDAQTERQYQN